MAAARTTVQLEFALKATQMVVLIAAIATAQLEFAFKATQMVVSSRRSGSAKRAWRASLGPLYRPTFSLILSPKTAIRAATKHWEGHAYEKFTGDEQG
jgi:hypothetical protein